MTPVGAREFSKRGGQILAAAYMIAFAVILLCFVAVWLTYSNYLYIGRDASFALWTSNAYREWASAFDVTAINPIQGMTSTIVAINPYMNPGEWIFFTDLPEGAKELIAYVVYFTEITITTFALGWTIGFSRLFSFVAAIWVVLLLLPPFNYIFGLQGWIATAAIYSHTLALSNIVLIIFYKIGEASWPRQNAFKRTIVNWLLATCIFVLVLMILLVAPFYAGGQLVGLALAGGSILLSSSTREQFLWRIASGLCVAAYGYALGFLEFFSASKAYSARFIGADTWLPLINWPIDISRASIAQARDMLCSMGVVCDRFPTISFALTGSYWLQIAIILGGLAAFYRMPKSLSRIGLYIAVVWFVLLVRWALIAIGLLPNPPLLSVAALLMVYPFLAFFSLYAIWSLFGLVLPNNIIQRREVAVEAIAVTAVTVGAVILVFAMHANSVNLSPILRPSSYPSSPIVDVLRREIALRPGEAFRGSVATILGPVGGTLRPLLGLTPDEPLRSGEIENFFRLAKESGSSHDLLDLWWWNIPTLSEYGQGVSQQLTFFILKFLSADGDGKDLNFAIPSAINIDILRAMGVRFIITDATTSSSEAIKRNSIALKNGAVLTLYELANPNIGTFSPVTLKAFPTTKEFVEQVRQNPNIFESTAYVSAAVEDRLVAAQTTGMTFEKGGVHVTGTSTGTSALLLPVQFSHCYEVVGPASRNVRVMRANMIHTLVIFKGDLDIHLRWRFNFWRGSGCRSQDVGELRALGLL